MTQLTAEEKRALVAQTPVWWHTIDLGDGIVTPGEVPPETHEILARGIPERLDGLSVLDVGTWDGYYAFLCERRGASVTAVDNEQNAQAHRGFETARRILGSSVTYRLMDLHDLSPDEGCYDLVLFFGVLYHLKNPLGALEVLSRVTKDRLLLESHYIKTRDEKVPLMKLYPGRELNDDPTNWWGPNLRCILDMLEVAGFGESRVLDTYLHDRKHRYGRVVVEARR